MSVHSRSTLLGQNSAAQCVLLFITDQHALSSEHVVRVPRRAAGALFCLDNAKIFKSKTLVAWAKFAPDRVFSTIGRRLRRSDLFNHDDVVKVIADASADDSDREPNLLARWNALPGIAKLYSIFKCAVGLCSATDGEGWSTTTTGGLPTHPAA